MSIEKKYLIIYHANCLDGITAAAVTHKMLVEVEKVEAENIYHRATSYGEDINEIVGRMLDFEIHTVYIVDFSFNLIELKEIAFNVMEVHLYDHHASAFRNLCGEEYVVTPTSREEFNLFGNVAVTLDNDESGASLCWKELFDDQFPTLVEYVRDYDLWRFRRPETKAINKYLKLQPKKIKDFLLLLSNFDEEAFVNRAYDLGIYLLEYEKSLENDLISQGTTPITINGIQGLVVNAPPTLASSVGNKLAATSGTFGAAWWQAARGEVRFSLRSIGDSCDVSKLAEAMGGGGHKNAAGFSMNAPEYDPRNGITLWSNS